MEDLAAAAAAARRDGIPKPCEERCRRPTCARDHFGSAKLCQSYRPAHNTHWIHARHIGQTPWGWRDAVVSGLDGGWTTVTYVGSGWALRLWHHVDLAGELEVGAPVRVHERCFALGGPFVWLDVVVEGGPGPVPEPADPREWEDRITGGVQSFATGRALALDWRDRAGD